MVRFLLGIDAGTSVIKSVIFDLDGHELVTASQETTLLHPNPFSAEQDMHEVWRAVLVTVRSVVQKFDRPNQIAAIGITGQGDGTWLVDVDRQPVRPAILWLDGRTADFVRQGQQNGLSDQLFAITGTALNTSNQAAHLRWLLDHEPATLRRAAAALRAKDWLFLNCTGLLRTDETDASHTYFATTARHVDERILALFGLSAYRSLLPEVKAAYKNTGELLPAVARELGLTAGLPVVGGPFDVVASDLGVGMLAPGDACTILGTAGIHQVVLDGGVMGNMGYTMCHAPANRLLRLLPTMTGTLNLQWFVDHFYSHEQSAAKADGRNFWDELEASAATIPPGCDGVVYHPYIDPAGERAPFVRPEARAQFTGLSARHSRAHLLRAVYEGVALSAMDCYDQLGTPVSVLKLAGGGARSRFWRQLFADALGCEVEVTEGTEFGAKGAAINAGVAIGLYSSYEAAVGQTVRSAHSYQPDDATTHFYRKRLTLYRETYEAMFPIWQKKS